MYSKDSIAEAPGAIRNTWWSIPICISTSILTCIHVSFNYLHIMWDALKSMRYCRGISAASIALVSWGFDEADKF